MKKIYLYLAVMLGLGVIVWMIFEDVTVNTIQHITFSPQLITGLVMAILSFLVQNIFMSLRYRLLSSKRLSFKKSLRVNILCEFTSAVTPSAVGGSSVVFVYLNREGLDLGKSTFVMLSSLFLDELFLFVSASLILCLVPNELFFGNGSFWGESLRWVTYICLLGIGLWTLLLYIAIFHKPGVVVRIVSILFKLPFLKRYHHHLHQFAKDILTMAKETKQLGRNYWIYPMLTTILSWCFRYGIVIMMLFAFSGKGDLLLAYFKQWILWILMLVTPTPGGSGLSEFMFREYYSDFLPDRGLTVIAALTWRFIFYYSYLILGTILIPSVFQKSKKNNQQDLKEP